MWLNRSDRLFVLSQENILGLFTTRKDEEILEKIGEKHKILFIKQIHSNSVIDIDQDDTKTGDGIITSQKDIFIGVKVADCLPVYFLSSDQIGIAHAGWRGTLNQIVVKMVEKFNEKPSYFFGPCINPCCYEIGEELYQEFKGSFPDNIFSRKEQKLFLDLKSANRYLLKGLKEIGSLDLCTGCNSHLFYSYRREKGTRDRNFALLARLHNPESLYFKPCL